VENGQKRANLGSGARPRDDLSNYALLRSPDILILWLENNSHDNHADAATSQDGPGEESHWISDSTVAAAPVCAGFEEGDGGELPVRTAVAKAGGAFDR
jgi:hypothetical protein